MQKSVFMNVAGSVALAIGCGAAPVPAMAKPIMVTWTITCTDAQGDAHEYNVLAPKSYPPSPQEYCPARGMAAGNVSGGSIRGVTTEASVRPDVPTGLRPVEAGSVTAVGAVDAVSTQQGRPASGKGDETGSNLPVLNCSQSQNNPASVNLSTGQPGWTLKLPNGSASAIVPTPNMVPSPWTAVPGAQWVGPQGAPQTAGTFTYETKVRVLKCPNGNPAKLTAQFRADNRGTLTLIDPAGNAVTTMNQAGTPNYGFLPASLSPASPPGVYSWSAPTNGIYTVRMTVQNSGGPTGVAANALLTR